MAEDRTGSGAEKKVYCGSLQEPKVREDLAQVTTTKVVFINIDVRLGWLLVMMEIKRDRMVFQVQWFGVVETVLKKWI